MRRRHLLALVILALVVATVLAVGPVRVWDWMTLRTVEEHFPNGQLKCRYRLRLWESGDEVRWGGGVGVDTIDFDRWYPNGTKNLEIRCSPLAVQRVWSPAGNLRVHMVEGTGIRTQPIVGLMISEQNRWKDGQIVETRTSPPWFTEEEILQAVEGAEE